MCECDKTSSSSSSGFILTQTHQLTLKCLNQNTTTTKMKTQRKVAVVAKKSSKSYLGHLAAS